MMWGSLSKAAARHKDDDRPWWVTLAAHCESGVVGEQGKLHVAGRM